MLTIALPWPPKELSPNARKHWRGLAKAKKAYRDACRVETLLQCRPGYLRLPERMHLTMDFVPPDRRKRDRDNLVAAMKAGLDGVADALGINDERFAVLTVRIVHGDRVGVHLRMGAAPATDLDGVPVKA